MLFPHLVVTAGQQIVEKFFNCCHFFGTNHTAKGLADCLPRSAFAPNQLNLLHKTMNVMRDAGNAQWHCTSAPHSAKHDRM